MHYKSRKHQGPQNFKGIFKHRNAGNQKTVVKDENERLGESKKENQDEDQEK